MLRAHQGLAKITSPKLHIDERFLAAPTSGNFSARKHPNKPGPESSNWRADMRPAPKPPHVWHPVGPQVDYDEIYEEAEPLEEDPPPPQLLYRPPHQRRRQERWIVRGEEDGPRLPQDIQEVLVQQEEEEEPQQQPQEAARQEIDLQEEMGAQVADPDVSRAGRVRKKTQRLGIEQERGGDDHYQDQVLQLSAPPSRRYHLQHLP